MAVAVVHQQFEPTQISIEHDTSKTSVIEVDQMPSGGRDTGESRIGHPISPTNRTAPEEPSTQSVSRCRLGAIIRP